MGFEPGPVICLRPAARPAWLVGKTRPKGEVQIPRWVAEKPTVALPVKCVATKYSWVMRCSRANERDLPFFQVSTSVPARIGMPTAAPLVNWLIIDVQVRVREITHEAIGEFQFDRRRWRIVGPSCCGDEGSLPRSHAVELSNPRCAGGHWHSLARLHHVNAKRQERHLLAVRAARIHPLLPLRAAWQPAGLYRPVGPAAAHGPHHR
jgi:hypothetical protein